MTNKTVRDYLTEPGKRIYDEGFKDGNQKQNELNGPCPVSQPGGNNKVCTCHSELKARIRNCLSAGGLFNMNLMEGDKVRDLLRDILQALYDLNVE